MKPCDNWQLEGAVWVYFPVDEDCGECFLCRRNKPDAAGEPSQDPGRFAGSGT